MDLRNPEDWKQAHLLAENICKALQQLEAENAFKELPPPQKISCTCVQIHAVSLAQLVLVPNLAEINKKKNCC